MTKKVDKKRLEEIDEHMENFAKDKKLQKQFDYIFVNDYTDKSKEKLLNVINKMIKEEIK